MVFNFLKSYQRPVSIGDEAIMVSQEILASLCQDFYQENLNLAQLSSKYHLSRYLVNKCLEQARNEGIITFIIQSPEARNQQLERQLGDFFGIKNLYILKNSSNPQHNLDNINRFAAHKIETYISTSHVVGTTWGSVIYNVINDMHSQVLENVTFTQFIGENMKYHSEAGSMRMVERVAERFSSEYMTLAGPLYIADDTTREGMLHEVATADTLKMAARMELIFTGLGTLDSVKSIPTWWKNIDRIFPQVNLEQIAGIAYGRPYDIYGNFLNQHHDTTFGLDLNTILQTPVRLALVKSRFKTRALLGALRGNLFTDIITNEMVAQRIVSELRKGN
jgi:DNA-binding transcriptional regulator LsrR (DeoR family)